jgi:hypothetical protein
MTSFNFDIIKNTQMYRHNDTFTQASDLIRDVCTTSITDTDQPIREEEYLYVIQKSPKWLKLRAAAQATASSIGKYIKSPSRFPTVQQLTEAWEEKLTHKPFTKTHAMTAHMNWGVVHEDVALMHFAIENMLCVVQVGTIKVPLAFVYSLNTDPDLTDLPCDPDHHLLISPDGVVQKPHAAGSGLDTELLGMLEIKCISPFHHLEGSDGNLKWIESMEKRQWSIPEEIPFVYIIQICLQAISGYYRLNMNGEHIMWFIRWSPKGFAEFQIKFGELIELGVLTAMLYFSLRRLTLEDLPLVYNEFEQKLHLKMLAAYKKVLSKMTHRYIDHSTLYPEFKSYKESTELHKFKVSD